MTSYASFLRLLSSTAVGYLSSLFPPQRPGHLPRKLRHNRVSRLACMAVITASVAPLAHATTTYYVGANGNDANSGTSSATPWRTIGKLNTKMASLLPGDAVMLRRGDIFRDDYIRCVNLVNANSNTTLTSNVPKCSGTSSAAITIGAFGSGSALPILDGADPLSLSWTLVSGSTYKATITGSMPSKLYVDSPTGATNQLLPTANYVGIYNPSTTYQPYDMVASGTSFFVRGPVPAASNVPVTNPSTWVNVTNTSLGNSSQTFPVNTGLQNVEETPGSWYGTGSTIYVHLADGSDPGAHTFEGTRRPYGVLLEGVNHVTVTNLTVERVQHSGIASITYPSDKGHYFVGEYIKIINDWVWNYGSIVADNLGLQEHINLQEAGILVRANGAYDPHELRGISISGNYVGTMDSYYGIRGQLYQSGIAALGIDGNGVANNTVISSNYVSTTNAQGIIYSTTGLYYSGMQTLNNGGRVTNNELTNNQGNLFFTATQGGLEDHNLIHDSYGEGVQTGGNSISTSSVPQVHSYNLIYNLGKSASGTLYNGFDCNGTLAGGYWLNNTVYNVNSAAITLEYGCTSAHVHNNIFDQHAIQFPAFDVLNPSYLLFYVPGAGDSGPDFSNNVWYGGSSPKPFYSSGAYFNCSNFVNGWPDANSACNVDPMLADPGTGNFTLQTSSPAIIMKAGITQ